MNTLLKWIIGASVACLLPTVPAFAQQSTARVLSTCGNITYPAGSVQLETQTTTGLRCTDNSSAPTTPTIVAPTNSLSSDASGSVTTGGTYQTALAQNLTRKNCTIQNNDTTKSEPLLVSTATSPNAGNSYILFLGDTYSCTQSNIVQGDAVKVSAATTGHTFAETSQ